MEAALAATEVPAGEGDVQRLLFYRLRDGCQMALPNYTPAGWYES